jgi:nicotinamide-nucleotide amidase
MKAEILSIGTELLLGSITDTNASWLAQQLPMLGVDLYYISAVGDNRTRLVETLQRAWQRSDLIICTGGLGPTDDDLTREAISDLLGEPMVVVPEVAQALRDWFAARGVVMPEKNVKQATLIASSQALENPVGTAPGWWVARDEHIIITMPGVPYEMKQMWENQAIPRLRTLLKGDYIYSRTLKVLGKGESAVEELVKDYIANPNPTTATYAKEDGVHLRLTAKAPDEATARDMIFELEMQIRAHLGTLIYGADEETIEGVIGEMMQDRALTLGVAEVGTGGYATGLLSNASNVRDFFKGGLISQQPAVLSQWGVAADLVDETRLVSKEVVAALATAARQQLASDVGLALAIAAGPADFGGKPAGTIIVSLDFQGSLHSYEFNFRTKPSEVKRWAALNALNILRRAMLK